MQDPHPDGADDLTLDAMTEELAAAGLGASQPGSLETEFDDPAALAREDLSGDGMLRGCAFVDYEGSPCPTVGDYPLFRRIGRGGMGVVYAGIHPRLRTPVAVKVMRPDAASLDPSLGQRFLREARLAARLSTRSPHLVLVYDVNQDPTTAAYYLVMEYVAGVSGLEWLRGVRRTAARRLSEQEALDLCIAATAGLAIAHKAGVIHRDVKPGNIMVPTVNGVVQPREGKLTDLGLARMEEHSIDLTLADVATLGTPGYAAPEQLEASRSARKPADVFSMGATLYELLTGELPYEAATAMARVVATLQGKVIPLRQRRPEVSDPVATLVDACLSTNPDQRYRDAPALLEALEVCRYALRESAFGESGGNTTSQVADLVRRSEVGRLVPSSGAAYTQVGTGGLLVLEGGPPGSSVELVREGDDEPYCALTLDDDGRAEANHVSQGRYQLNARHEDYEDFTSRVTIRDGGDTHFLLGMRTKSGFLAVDSEPRGARALIGGEFMGRTPLRRLRLRAGEHQLVLRREGHGQVKLTLRVRPGELLDLGKVELPPTSELDLSGLEGGVEVLIDGRAVEHGQEVLAGVHEVLARRAGFGDQSAQVEVPAGAVWRPEIGAWRPGAWALVSDRALWCAADSAERERVARALAERLETFEFLMLTQIGRKDGGAFVAAFRHIPTDMKFVLVPGDSFRMGSPADETGRRSDERCHRVTLTPYLLASTPVPQRSWERVTGTQPAQFRGAQLPVENVSWADCTAFCAATKLDLPTEAQWEYACRGLRTTPYSFGTDVNRLPDWGWFAGNSSGRPGPVNERPENALGVAGMHGGVWEWCSDGYSEYAFEASFNPRGAETAAYRVFRGGSWADRAEFARASARGAYRPDYQSAQLGLRPALTLKPSHLGEDSAAHLTSGATA